MADISHPNFDAFQAAVAAATAPDPLTDWTVNLDARTAVYNGSDNFVQFTGNFTDRNPATWVIPRISQRTNAISITMHNANIVFTNGSTGFPGGDSFIWSIFWSSRSCMSMGFAKQ